MGTLRHLPEGQDFGAEHFGAEKDFGFSGSAEKMPATPMPQTNEKPTSGGMSAKPYAKGGMTGHPMGHQVIATHHDPRTGAVTMQHAHGGHTIVHPNGHMTHHGADGQPMGAPSSAQMGGGHSQEGTLVGALGSAPPSSEMGPGGGGDETPAPTAMRRGGAAGRHASIPHGMKPKGSTNHSPINTAPRNPMRNPSKRNAMPGGEMPYGVEPSAEPDQAGTEQGIPQLARGGRVPC